MAVANPIQLLVGLGNPGPEYADTRHNAGTWALAECARQLRIDLRPEPKFLGRVGVGNAVGSGAASGPGASGGKIWLLEPSTYMNLSGRAIRALANYYQIPPEGVLVLHDELDLPPGVVRLKEGGGHGGHNGLKSAIAELGSNAFTRLRIGIGHPGDRALVTPYVLSRPSRAEEEAIRAGIDAALAFLPEVLAGQLQQAMNHLNARAPG
jgi:PTH1 family peptidyl-tRNA hydrolase